MSLLTHLFTWISRLLKSLWLFIAGVVAVTAMYYLLTGVEQGVDVVIQSGESLDRGVLAVLAIFLWSFLVWFSSRMLSYIRQHRDDEIFFRRATADVRAAMLYQKYGIPADFYQHIPRLLAYNCFVSVQVAIFHLPTFFGLSTAEMLLAVVLHHAFYFMLHAWFVSGAGLKKTNWLDYLNPALIAGYSVFLIYLLVVFAKDINVVTDPLRHRFWLSLVALLMFLLQVAVVFLFILRRQSIDRRRRMESLRPSRLLQAIGFNPAFNAAESPYFRLLNSTAVVGVVIYLAAIFLMPFAALLGPMAFTLLALGILTGVANLVTLVSIRRSFNMAIVLFALAFLWGQYRDPYPVRLLEAKEAPLFGARPDASAFLRKWFSHRLSLLSADSTARFPVYIILSNGGASRAGKWTSDVLTTLQDTSFRSVEPGDSFKDHILCIAGASGGAVGNGVFYSLLRAEQEGKIAPDSFRAHGRAFFNSDFLTYTVGRLLGPDIIRHLLPFNLPLDNRADALERVISSGPYSGLPGEYFDKPLSAVFDTTGRLPAFFINTTQVDNGMPGVISSVRLPESQRQDVLGLVDSMGVRYGKGNMRLSTAVVLSSRFPYVSPAGKVFDRYYVDGGYFDNSGAGTVLEFIRELNRFMEDTTANALRHHLKRFTFHVIHITNAEVLRRPSGDIHPLTNDLLAPVLTLAGMQGSSTSITDGILVNAFRRFNRDTANAIIVYSLYDEDWPGRRQHTTEYEEGYPMSWSISDYQRARMNAALARANRKNIGRFSFGN